MEQDAFKSPAEFLFETPLYAERIVSSADYAAAFTVFFDSLIVDGWCPWCHGNSTFHEARKSSWRLDPHVVVWVQVPNSLYAITVECTRDRDHQIIFYVRKQGDTITKTGQWPSFADIANDESKQYRKVLSSVDADELHKAIGLAAHGVGIGSFVYLRRIFERLVAARYDQHKAQHGWKDEDFYRLRMDEKIALLAAYLPAFLVEHKKVYAVLSLGIHELSETKCLAYFEILKDAIILILEEDAEAKRREERRKKLAEDLARVTGLGKDKPEAE